MNFDWSKFDGDWSKVPADVRAAMRREMQKTELGGHSMGSVLEDIRSSLFKPADDADMDKKIKAQFDKLEFDRKLDQVKTRLGDKFDEYLPKVADKLRAGYDPTDAFKLLEAEDYKRTVEADEAARKAREAAAQAGVHGAGGSNGAGAKDSFEKMDKEAVAKKKNELARMDFEEEQNWRKQNPGFFKKEQELGFVRQITR